MIETGNHGCGFPDLAVIVLLPCATRNHGLRAAVMPNARTVLDLLARLICTRKPGRVANIFSDIGRPAVLVWPSAGTTPSHDGKRMQALFIGQTYIDVTFITDHMPVGDEKHVARRLCRVVRRQRGDRGVLLRQARHRSRT